MMSVPVFFYDASDTAWVADVLDKFVAGCWDLLERFVHQPEGALGDQVMSTVFHNYACRLDCNNYLQQCNKSFTSQEDWGTKSELLSQEA